MRATLQIQTKRERESASALLLFGGGFSRDGLIALCEAELQESVQR